LITGVLHDQRALDDSSGRQEIKSRRLRGSNCASVIESWSGTTPIFAGYGAARL
jgi:hypothetical protein